MKNLVLTNHKIFKVKPTTPTTTTAVTENGIPDQIKLDAANTAISLDHARQVVYYVDDQLNFRAYHLLTQQELLCVPLIVEGGDEQNEYQQDEDMDEDYGSEELLRLGDRIVSVQYVQENESVVVIASNNEIGQILSISTTSIVPLPKPENDLFASADVPGSTAGMDDFGGDFFATTTFENGQENDEEESLGSIECIGQIEGGFSSAVWSPDRELLVLGCNNGNIIVMSNQYAIIGETPITGQIQQQQQLAQSNPYVHLAGTIQHKEYNELTKANTLLDTDSETNITISWRGDSQYFATNSLKQLENGEYIRYLRVWSRQCTLTSQSEQLPSSDASLKLIQNDSEDFALTIDNTDATQDDAYNYHRGYSHHLAWRPSGNIIATITTSRVVHGNIGLLTNKTNTASSQQQQTQHMVQQQVQFFERNGLERYSFPLHEPTLPGQHAGFVVLDMTWSTDSTILTISMYDLSKKSLLIKCFTTKNYHWYCKYVYTLPLSCATTAADVLTSVKFVWQYNRTTRLVVLSNNTTLHCLDLVDDGYQSAAPLYTSAVINGRVLGLTHLSRAAIPPPLSSRELLFHNDITSLSMCSTVNPREVGYENSCIQSTSAEHYRATTASTNGIRMDIVTPTVVLTTDRELLFVTDACEATSQQVINNNSTAHHNKNYLTNITTYKQDDNTIKTTVFAPDYQPERQQALNRAMSTAKAPAFASLTFKDIALYLSQQQQSTIDEISYWRHVEWVHCAQWRALLIQFTQAAQQQFLTTQQQDETFAQYLQRTQPSAISPDATNIVTVVQTTADAAYDQLIIIAFTLDLIYSSTTQQWVPKATIQSVTTQVLDPMLCDTMIDASPILTQEGISTQTQAQAQQQQAEGSNALVAIPETTATIVDQHVAMSSPATELCPFSITRVSVTPYSKPYPNPPEPPVEEQQPATPPPALPAPGTPATTKPTALTPTTPSIKKINPALDLAWYEKHQETLESPPLLSLLTSAGHVLQIPISPQAIAALSKNNNNNNNNNALISTDDNNDNNKPLTMIYRKNQLITDCLYFLVTSMYGNIVYVGLDQQQRLLINHTVIAPQCMSFGLVQFSDLQAYPLPPTTTQANISLQQTGHGQIPTYVTNQQLSQVTTAMRTIPQGLFPAYLLVTVASQQHALFTVDLKKCIDDNINPMSELRQDPNMVRVVEKGAKIVQCIPDILRPRVVLQQPRGNLEVVTPRSLGLTSIFCSLMCQQYNIAFRSLRTNKIDLNLLIDHDRESFLTNIVEILKELYLPDNITLLLSSLTNSDCTSLPTNVANPDFQIQYPRYHQMFTSQTTVKRLMKLLVVAKDVIDKNELLTTIVSASQDYYYQDAAVLNNNNNAYNSYTQIKTSSTPNIYIDSDDEDNNNNAAEKKETLVDQFISNGYTEQPQNDQEDGGLLDFNQQPQNNGAPQDLEILRKQFQLKKAEDHERRKTANIQKQQLKSTAQSFSNRTRIHKQLGNDTTNDNNKYENTLGAEAGQILLADGSGQTYQQQLSRVEHWGVGEMDVRHVYGSAEKLIKLYNKQYFGSESSTTAEINNTTTALVEKNDDNTAAVVENPENLKKVNIIADIVLKTLTTILLTPEQSDSLQQQQQQYLLTILTAHLRKSPPDFLAAMNTLQTVAKQESSISNKVNAGAGAVSISTKPRQVNLGPRPQASGLEETATKALSAFKLTTITAERALKYMLILADKDELWKAALSTYNLTLAQSVAEHSGRDPKDYVPFLTTLTSIALRGPQLTAMQTTPIFVQQQFQDVVHYLKLHNPLLLQKLNITEEDETTLLQTPPTTAALNEIPLPQQLGQHLQHAYIDIYLTQYPQVILHYFSAMQYIQKLFQYVVPTDEDEEQFDEEALFACFNVQNKQQLLLAWIKYAYILQSMYKLVINYVEDYPYLNHIVIHLFCSPLPPQIAPPQRAANPTTQAKIPIVPADAKDIFTTYQYKILHSYALWLINNKQYNDAAYIYLHLGHINDAVTAWANCGEYKNVLIYTQRFAYLFPAGKEFEEINKNEITTTQHHTKVQLFTKLSRVLIDEKRNYLMAAQIQYYQLNAPNAALQTLFTHKEWKQAMLYATTYIASVPEADVNTSEGYNFDTIFLAPIQAHIAKEVAGIKQQMADYKQAVERLRLVRLVKQLIFGAQGNNASCVSIYNHGAIDLGNVTGLIPKPHLVLRLPGDDVLEFIITGCWRGQQTGLDVNGEGFAGSLGALSTATGVSLISLAPSIAQSIQSLSSAFSGQSQISQFSHGRLSNGSAMSTGQGSMLSLGAAETALTADERRLKKHMSKIKSRQSKKKVRGGDPREEEKLLLEVAFLTPRAKRLAQWYELIDVCSLCGENASMATLLALIDEFLAVVKKEESTPMYIIETFTDWQRTAITEFFNWPQASYIKDEDEVAKDWAAKQKEESDDKLKQELSHLSKQQKLEWDRTQSIQLQKQLPLHVYQQPVPTVSSAATIAGDYLQKENKPDQKGGANKDKHLVAQQKHHQGPTTLEQIAKENAGKQTWKTATPAITTLCETLPTIHILTKPSLSTTPTTEQQPTTSAMNMSDILYQQIVTDLQSTRRTTQLRMNHNPFGQKSATQKLIDHLTE